MKALSVPAGVRSQILSRDGFRCARCSRSVLNFPSSVHHRVPRRMGGTRDPRINDPRNLVRLCGSGVTGCHGWVESHRDQARVDGWLLASLDELDTPMVTVCGGTIRLYGNGFRVDSWADSDAP